MSANSAGALLAYFLERSKNRLTGENEDENENENANMALPSKLSEYRQIILSMHLSLSSSPISRLTIVNLLTLT